MVGLVKEKGGREERGVWIREVAGKINGDSRPSVSVLDW
jgi:hypothetical protein